jgi:hypothetical protein
VPFFEVNQENGSASFGNQRFSRAGFRPGQSGWKFARAAESRSPGRIDPHGALFRILRVDVQLVPVWFGHAFVRHHWGVKHFRKTVISRVDCIFDLAIALFRKKGIAHIIRSTNYIAKVAFLPALLYSINGTH